MIIWRGFGVLVIVIVLLVSLLVGLIATTITGTKCME